MNTVFEAVVSCMDCNMRIRRRLEDIEDPQVISTDSVLLRHNKDTGHEDFSLDIEVVPEIQLRIVGVV